jgi:hypothetical protein
LTFLLYSQFQDRTKCNLLKPLLNSTCRIREGFKLRGKTNVFKSPRKIIDISSLSGALPAFSRNCRGDFDFM